MMGILVVELVFRYCSIQFVRNNVVLSCLVSFVLSLYIIFLSLSFSFSTLPLLLSYPSPRVVLSKLFAPAVIKRKVRFRGKERHKCI